MLGVWIGLSGAGGPRRRPRRQTIINALAALIGYALGAALPAAARSRS